MNDAPYVIDTGDYETSKGSKTSPIKESSKMTTSDLGLKEEAERAKNKLLQDLKE